MFWPPARPSRYRWLVGLLLGLVLAAPAGGCAAAGQDARVAELLAMAGQETQPGARIAVLSAGLLNTPYRAGTLDGGPDRPEQLVINLTAVDCLTFLDYVEALRRVDRAEEFPANLVAVRYRDGVVSWSSRRHFFTDWVEPGQDFLVDVTGEIGGAATAEQVKQLNLQADGSRYLPDIPVQQRTVRYIPTAALDDARLGRLQTGDYLGFYSPAPGLDVSHTGIVIRRDGELFLRHASSQPDRRRVVDTPLIPYLAKTPGLLVFRPQR